MRSVYQRIKDHLAGITLPRVASQLGPAWRVEGLRLTGPRGEGFEFDLSWLFGSPELVIFLDSETDEAAEDSTRVSMAPTARPETIVRELRAELLPIVARLRGEPASGPDSDEGRCTSPSAIEIPSKPAAGSPRLQTPALR